MPELSKQKLINYKIKYMKKVVSIVMMFVFSILLANATVRTVSNDPNSPGQYTDLPTAVAAANAGDTLLVSGSSNLYADISLTKKLIILGTGYNPYKDFSASVSKINNVTFSDGSDGSVLQGFVINGGVSSTGNGVNNIVVKRNQFSSTTYLLNCTGNSWLICENYIVNTDRAFGYTISINGSSYVIQNNLFLGTPDIFNLPTNYNTLFVNNTFLIYNDQYNSAPNLALNNALIANNIFYGTNGDMNASYNVGTGNTISNNIVYNNSYTNPLNVAAGVNQGVGNQYAVDPKFTNLVTTTSNSVTVPVVLSSNLQLLSTSTVKKGGTDGKELGIYGGSTPAQSPLTGCPSIPQVNSMTLNNLTVAPGGTLSITIKAKEGN